MELKKLGELKEIEYAGSRIRIVEGEKLHVSFVIVPPKAAFEPHGHEEEGLGYMLRGSLEVYTDISPEKVVLTPQDVMILQPGEKLAGRNPGSEEAWLLAIGIRPTATRESDRQQ